MTRDPRHRVTYAGRLPLRLIALQLLLTLLVGAAVGTATIAYHRTVRRGAEAQMRDTAALTGVFLRQNIGRATGALAQLSRQPGITEALRDPQGPGAQAAVQNALLVMNLANPDLYSALVVDGRGAVLGDRPAVVPAGFDVSDRAWFTRAAASSSGDVSPVFESALSSGLYLTTISVPVRSDGALLGVLTVVQRLDWYQQFVGSYTAARKVTLAIVDQDGAVVSDGAGRLNDLSTEAQRRRLGRRLLGAGDDTVRASSSEALTTGTGADRWRVVAEIPTGEAMRPAKIFTVVAAGAGLLVVLALNLLLWLRFRESRERARAAESVRDSRRQLREIADASPDLLFRMETDGTVRFASRASLTVLGIPATDLIGQNLLSLLEVAGPVALSEHIFQLVYTREPMLLMARTGPAGMRRIVELEVSPPEEGSTELLGAVRDVTDRRSAQDQVEQLFQLTGEFMAVIDFDGRLVQVNPVWEAALNRQNRDLVGRSFFLFFRFYDLLQARTEFDRMTRDGQVLAFENRYVPPATQDAPARSMLWTMSADADRQLVYAVGHDITGHKDLERALGEARDEALAASRTKSEFIATMSHEIRTPMNGVIGLTDLLQGTALDANQRRYVEGVRTAGEALLSVINDILDFSKIEAGRMVLEEVDFHPREVVDEVLTLVRQSATAKGLELELDVETGVPSVVNGDPGRLRQLLLNLMHNAVKFTAAGRITLRARPGTGTPPMPVLPPELHPTIVFEVSDTGIGIAPDRLQELFEPFAQADAGTTREYGGTGLGLSICRRLAELMSGTLDARSVPGEGATFVAELTFGRPTSDGRSRSGDARSLTVMVVDEDVVRREAMAAQLADWGMRALPVGSPDEAVMALAWTGATSGGVDLVLVELAEAGTELIRRLRTVEGLDAVPVIVVDDADLPPEEVVALTITAVLRRPVKPSAIFDALSRVSPVRAGQSFAPEPAPGVEAVPGGRRLLLVEDNEINRMVALGMLGRLGYEVDVAEDGLGAVDLGSRLAYAGILMDCQMPRLDGYAATEQLRARELAEGAARTPIIAMTAATMPADRKRCLDSGMDDFIAKPVRFATLRDTLSRWLDAVAEASPDKPASDVVVPAPRGADEDIEERLVELLGGASPGEQELVRDIVASFGTRAPDLAAAVAGAVAAGDVEAVALHAHALAGAALNLGTTAIAQVCRRIEGEARAGRLERAAEEAAALDGAVAAELPRLSAAVAQHLGHLDQKS